MRLFFFLLELCKVQLLISFNELYVIWLTLTFKVNYFHSFTLSVYFSLNASKIVLKIKLIYKKKKLMSNIYKVHI